MNSVFFKRASLLLTLTTLSVFASGLSAQAQTNNSNFERKDNKVLTSASVLKSGTGTNVAQVEPTAPDNATPTTPGTDGTYTPTTPDTQSVPPTTTPETTPTTPTQETQPTESTFGDDVEAGRATRGGSSYIGVAGNIGLGGGETALGEGNFSVISKIGFTNAVSVRPSVVIGDNTTILIPVTYDFSVRPTGVDAEAISTFAPYIGAGIGIATGDNSDVAPMLTAGVDVPIASQFTATAAVNAGFFDSTSVGLAIGVGYNFGGF